MKKYMFCFLLFLASSVLCTAVGYILVRQQSLENQMMKESQLETSASEENQAVVNRDKVKPEVETQIEEYYLVSEAGMLLVFLKDQSTICLYTHIPVTDFPEKERERLMEGIWFPSMMEVFHYLESYTS